MKLFGGEPGRHTDPSRPAPSFETAPLLTLDTNAKQRDSLTKGRDGDGDQSWVKLRDVVRPG